MTGMGFAAKVWHGSGMRRYPFFVIALCVAILPGAGQAQLMIGPRSSEPEKPLGPSNDGLPGWLAGTWAMQDGAAWADAVWTVPRGGMMLGLGRIGFGPDVENWDSSRIVRKADGTISLIMQRKAGVAQDYPLAIAGTDSVEFANPQYEPQRIRFWRAGQLLMTETSRMDGSDGTRLYYRPVETAPKD